MAIYSLHEMAGLLKTGLWQGGEVEKLGYIGTAVPMLPAPACGLMGVYISYDTMLRDAKSRCKAAGVNYSFHNTTLYRNLYDLCSGKQSFRQEITFG